MQTTPETSALLDELYERCASVTELSGPQIEAWVSGLFPVFDDSLTARLFVDHCAAQKTPVGAIVVAALAELTEQLDGDTCAHARSVAADLEMPLVVAQLGTSEPAGAWIATARFGRSIVLGFDNQHGPELSDADLAGGVEAVDLRHSILVEISRDGTIEDIQLAGAPKELLEEAAGVDGRVVVEPSDVDTALALIFSAWPSESTDPRRFGPGLSANQQFVRRRIAMMNGGVLGPILSDPVVIDVQRGLSDDEYEAANRAAVSTLTAAIRMDAAETVEYTEAVVAAWVGVIHGDGGELGLRERDALLWLEWADWLGAGIGLWRAGVGSAAAGATLVNHVNKCPEVSSTITKADRDYAEWAFEIALDLLEDAGAVEDGLLTGAGHAALAPAMFKAWG